MGYSIETYTYSGGPQTFNIPFALGYLSQSEITAQVVGEVDGLGDPINRAFTWNSATEILVTDPITVGSQVRVARTVDKLNLEVDFLAAGTATKSALDRSARHVLMAVHEALDGRIGGQTRSVDDILSDIKDNAAAATASQTASAASATAAAGSASAASASATAAAGSATAAAASASAASTSQTAAAGSATSASGSASTATTQAANASASASAAATSATSANLAKVASEAARDATLTALDSFDERYLGQKAANPTLDNGGGALVPGALYFNTVLNEMRVYDGSSWLAAYASLSGALLRSNNLSDLDDAALALQNLGLTANTAELNTLGGITGMASQAAAEAGTDNATLMTPLRVAQAIDAQAAGLTANVQEFTSSGTWTKPANAKLVMVELWGAGGGGGSGRRTANNGTSAGGSGGGGAAGVFSQYRASELTSTVSITIGAGGAGGAARTTDEIVGAVGSPGGDSTFGSYLTGKGGGAGQGGATSGNIGGFGSGWTQNCENTPNTDGNSFGGIPSYSGRSGDTGNRYSYNVFGGAAGGVYVAPGGGAAGGDIAKPGTGAAGGGAGGGYTNTTLANAGLGGVRWGSNIPRALQGTGVGLGVNGAVGSAFGNGGGGGGHGRTAAAGNGGAGGTAAGGGGGGGSANGFTSGAGGAGGDGFCRVTTYS